MTKNSNINGRAYEFAWINTLYKHLCKIRNTKIIYNSSYDTNKKAWELLNEDMQKIMVLSAESAIDSILEMEPLLLENPEDELSLVFQNDQKGIKGDVRDILLQRSDIEWEIGISCKHNHNAVKHSRISRKLDFGDKWFGIPCSKEYWDSVEPIFNQLENYKSMGMKWSEITNKEDSIYVPLLQSFIYEIKRSYELDNKLPKRMVEYLVGVNDYYKAISHDNKELTCIHTFNMHGTLNKVGKNKESTIKVPLVELPTKLIDIQFKDNKKNTVEMYLNNGWQLSFRIHNASSKVEPSLKFDIQFVGTPVTILTIKCIWNKRK